MKVLLFICFCLVLPLTGRQLRNDVTLYPSAVSGAQNTQHAAENKQGPLTKSQSNTHQNKPVKNGVTANAADEKNTFSSLFGYFLEPEFAGILLLVAIVGLSGMKHAD